MKRAAFCRFSLTPVFAGVLFCHLLLSVSCKKGETPDWGQTSAEISLSSSPLPEKYRTSPVSSSHGGFRFIAYNVENWLTMDRMAGKKRTSSPKPEAERNAAISLLARQKPDVIGLCEIGTINDLREIQTRLKSAGVDLPHLHYTSGTDETRRLGLLSKFPVTSTATPAQTSFRMHGMTYGINRGILDATLAIHGVSYRFLGVHFKSRREIEGIDQEEMRLHEAKLLRRHIDTILSSHRKTRLIVYGDFNDTRATPTIKSVTGGYTDTGYLTAIPFQDSTGTTWTHHWKPHDIYSRFDFVFISRELRRLVDFKASRIIDDPLWQKASDHRPLLAVFR